MYQTKNQLKNDVLLAEANFHTEFEASQSGFKSVPLASNFPKEWAVSRPPNSNRKNEHDANVAEFKFVPISKLLDKPQTGFWSGLFRTLGLK